VQHLTDEKTYNICTVFIVVSLRTINKIGGYKILKIPSTYILITRCPQGLGLGVNGDWFHTFEDTKICGCSSPSHEMVHYLHITYAYLPQTLNHP
jgi:hypothetical protein